MVLITGGSGFLADGLLPRLLQKNDVRVRLMARNEGNLLKVKQKFDAVEVFTGDIADEFAVQRALVGVDTVYHLAAFKHVGLAENNTYQCLNSNTIGTLNLLKHFKGKLFVAISTDKAAQPVGVYGQTKRLMEKLIKEFEQVNKDTKYRVVRYGNVLYSTGSVLCKWKDTLLNGGEITITDPDATRFFWTIDQAVDLIFECVEKAQDSTPYCPSMKSLTIGTLAHAMQIKYGGSRFLELPKMIGLQPGENKHEKVLDEGPYSNEVEQYTLEETIKMI